MTSASDPIWVHSRPVSRVAIVGGTHGNETNGVAIARHFLRHPELASRPSFETTVLLHNVAAIEKNVRYVEEDLNRCYFAKDLADPARATLEATRAKEVNAILGPKGSASPAVDLIIDLHNTTANTGVALMMPPQDELSHAIGAHLVEHDASVRIVNFTAGKADYPMLPTVGRHGMTFEVGAVPWGCVDGALYEQSLRLLALTLDYVHAHNLAIAAGSPSAWRRAAVPVYEAVRTVDYPRYADDNTISAMVHPSIQGRDFTTLKPGEPAFLTMEGATVGFEPTDEEVSSGEVCYPFFINEAAYYEKGIAFMVAHRVEQPVRVLESTGSATQAEPSAKRSRA
jgi:succinylglutamate desuccinylase